MVGLPGHDVRRTIHCRCELALEYDDQGNTTAPILQDTLPLYVFDNDMASKIRVRPSSGFDWYATLSLAKHQTPSLN